MKITVPLSLFPFSRIPGTRLWVYASMLASAVLVGLLVSGGEVLLAGALLILGTLLFLALHRPDLATLLVVFLLYLNAPAVATRFHGIPAAAAGSFVLLLSLPLVYYLFVTRSPVLVDGTLILMGLFLALLLLGSWLVSLDVEVSRTFILTFLSEGVLLYFLVLNTVRSLRTLRGVLWVLLLAGSLMGGLTLYSELTGSYGNNFAGLVQRNTPPEVVHESTAARLASRSRERIQGAHRSEGPIGDANRFAQVLLVLFPVGLFLLRWESGAGLKIAAALASLLALGGFFLTYSRGGFLVLAFLGAALLYLGRIRWTSFLLGTALVLALTWIAAPGCFGRIATISHVQSLWTAGAEQQADGATRGRITEMLSALRVFLDHPVLGVGPGQYMPFYSQEYQSDPEIAFRQIRGARRAHSLYFELAAETGILGLGTFLGMAFLILKRLWSLAQGVCCFCQERRELALFLSLSLLSYLGTAFFLHLAYQRYYWTLLAVCGAAVHLLSAEPAGSQPAGGAVQAAPGLIRSSRGYRFGRV